MFLCRLLLYILCYIIQEKFKDFLKVFCHIKFHVYTLNDATVSSITYVAGLQVAGLDKLQYRRNIHVVRFREIGRLILKLVNGMNTRI
jgi:hypothetical protein